MVRVKDTAHVRMAAATVALCATVLLTLAPPPASAGEQTQVGTLVLDEKAKAARARQIAQQFETNARVLTVFDRQGKVVATVGERALYNQPVFSPDRTRVAVNKFDGETESGDVWVVDVATGRSTRITSSQPREGAGGPVWSPDGRQIAYSAQRGGHEGLYRRASNGEGPEELLYQHPGANMLLTDWSSDGRFLSFSASDLSGGTLYVLPLAGEGKRTPIEVFRLKSQLARPRFSPDGRFLSYASTESGNSEVYVLPFDPASGAEAMAAAKPWQVSVEGGQGAAAYWRRDGKELYYIAADGGVMAVTVATTPTFASSKPTLLFRLSQAVPVGQGFASVSEDGDRVVIAVPHAPTLQQITVFDRQGNALSKVEELGRYASLALSPDGSRVAIVRLDPQNGNADLWTFDLASGKGARVTNDAFFENTPIWSADGRDVAYVSTRGSFSSIYRKAADGTGQEEQLFQYTPGAGAILTDWSADGKFMTFFPAGGGILHVLPVTGTQKPTERKAIDWLREEYNVLHGRFSPDARFIAYMSDELVADAFEVYVHPIDTSQLDAGAGVAKPVMVSATGTLGMISWRQDGKELYYLTPEWEVMAVDITTTPAFQAATPRLLFKFPRPLPGNPRQWKSVSSDGRRFVFAINVPASATAR